MHENDDHQMTKTLSQPLRTALTYQTELLPSPDFESLAPIVRDYPVASIAKAFNWEECLQTVPQGEWYLVVFRSVRRRCANEQLLTEFDDRAFMEASGAPGFLHYFRGELADTRERLSFCLWTDRESARIALRLPRHQAAVKIASLMYETYQLERYLARKPALASTITFHRLQV